MDPAKIQTPLERRDKGNYCRFYKDYGNNTDECRTLKDVIKAFICRRHLSYYVAKKVDQPKQVEEKAVEQPQDN